MDRSRPFRFSIDRGGTFTDIYAEAPGDPGFRVMKLLSEDPAHYADAAWEGIRRIVEDVTGESMPIDGADALGVDWIRIGTTLATNALLERRGERVGLVITRGFADLLAIGKQNRPDLFDLNIKKPPVLYEAVVEVAERVRLLPPEETPDPAGCVRGVTGEFVEILEEPDWPRLRKDLAALRGRGITSLAVVLMHAYVFPGHEVRIGAEAKALGFDHVALSSRVMPRIKMVDRGETCLVDAYLTPKIARYIAGFREKFRGPRLWFMRSDGGLAAAEDFTGPNAVLSGPAGGVVGYARTAWDPAQKIPVIGFDMGGTSTDVSRYDGAFDWVQETEVGGVHLQAPKLNIHSVAAGGGSRLFFRHGMFVVGPESAGADPGPACYRKGGPLSITDANLLLGRLHPEYFPKVFGPGQDQPLDRLASLSSFEQLLVDINRYLEGKGRPPLSTETAALGFLQVANEQMARAIRQVTVARGHDARAHTLACFGGAGAQHACALARLLGIGKVHVHRFAGILSAYGLGLADLTEDLQEPAAGWLDVKTLGGFLARLDAMEKTAADRLRRQGQVPGRIETVRFLNLRYEGTGHPLLVREPADRDFLKTLREQHRREYGFDLEGRKVHVDDLKVRAQAPSGAPRKLHLPPAAAPPAPAAWTRTWFEDGWRKTPLFRHAGLGAGAVLPGPALIILDNSTVVIEPGCTGRVTAGGDLDITVPQREDPPAATDFDPVRLAVFGHRFMSIAEQMGRTLQRTAVSVNIKEREDFSCAVFSPQGDLVANAPHQPVHLGSMSEAVKAQIRLQGAEFQEGDVWVSNHPRSGGTHLPDMTVITPVLEQGRPIFFVASRGHHADIGGIAPGSMPPFATRLEEEGVAIASCRLIAGGRFQEEAMTRLLSHPPGVRADGRPIPGTRALADNLSDLKAQAAANQRGIVLLQELIEAQGLPAVHAYMRYIQEAAAHAVRDRLASLARTGNSILSAEDFLDAGIPIRLRVTLFPEGRAIFDFAGTGGQLAGNLNAPPAVTHSAVLYCLRCLIPGDMPLNQGCLEPVEIRLPPGSLLSPAAEAAVAAGNVLTSQRIVDVIFKAFGAVAASQGCMNNLTFGGDRFGYYETIGGGAGAGPNWHGASGVHTHMTNTRITDPEVLEKSYPVLLRTFALRRVSGGPGQFRGGDGLIREIEFLSRVHVAILSERRVYAPYGLEGGRPGAKGKNLWMRQGGGVVDLGGKNEIQAEPGDRIKILTPGGGGYGPPPAD